MASRPPVLASPVGTILVTWVAVQSLRRVYEPCLARNSSRLPLRPFEDSRRTPSNRVNLAIAHIATVLHNVHDRRRTQVILRNNRHAIYDAGYACPIYIVSSFIILTRDLSLNDHPEIKQDYRPI